MTVSPPRHVIRFYGNPKYALESIRLKKITFLHADKLNDPFDPPFYFITDFNKDYQALIKYVQQYNPDDLQRFKKHLPKNNWGNFLTQIEEYFNKCRNNAFIFSTCGIDNQEHPKDSLYMWGHYGNGHRGVAIEFDTNLLKRAVLKSLLKKVTEETDPLFKICYQSDLPKITCRTIYQSVINILNNESSEKTELFDTIQFLLSTKSRVWKKENEWRFILSNNKSKRKIGVALEDDTITALFLGCRTEDHVKDDLIFETQHKFPNAKIYKSKIAQDNFALVFEPLF
jgi:hypothetical protein